MIKSKNQYINREISWLSFNERVLQESADKNVPLIERLRFLGIFSNNLDEFFKVRYATVKRILEAGRTGKSVLGGETAKDLLEEITDIVIKQQTKSLKILSDIEKELEAQNIFLINEKKITESQCSFIKNYFIEKVSPVLMTIILNDLAGFPMLEGHCGLSGGKIDIKETAGRVSTAKEKRYALIEIPKGIDRFVVLAERGR